MNNQNGIKITPEKAQEALKQVSQGKKTTNEVRLEFGLKPINGGDNYLTKAQSDKRCYWDCYSCKDLEIVKKGRE